MRTRLLVLAIAFLSSACTTSSGIVPNAAEWRHAAMNAIKDPDTWVPAALALGVVATDSDHEISEWAVEETPIFGSAGDAENFSDTTKLGVHLLMLGTALAPRVDDAPISQRLLTAAGNELATYPNDFVTEFGKEEFDRERPDATSRTSFPSGHASTSASYAAIAERNLQDVRASARVKRATRITARVLVGMTSWARIEAEKHYPTDVLVGMALGNLVASFVDRAFRGNSSNHVDVTVECSDDGVAVLIALRPAARSFRGPPSTRR